MSVLFMDLRRMQISITLRVRYSEDLIVSNV